MKLLILTQIVDRDDPVLGFFHRWIEEFSQRAESVEVICLYEGRHDLPKNVKVHSLGKEKGRGRLAYLISFYTYIVRLRRSYDAVFVHMNSEYVLLGGVLWRALRKPIALWYTHGSVTLRLRIATWLADAVFTASAESMRIQTRKRIIVGHGIDLKQFSPRTAPARNGVILALGRISPVKHLERAIRAVAILRARGIDAFLTVVGAPATESDRAHERELRELAGREGVSDRVLFSGPTPHDRIPQIMRDAQVFLHTSETGSIDKVVIEALATGLPVVTTSDVFKDLLPVIPATPEAIADALERELAHPSSGVQEKVAGYSLSKIIGAIVDRITELCVE